MKWLPDDVVSELWPEHCTTDDNVGWWALVQVHIFKEDDHHGDLGHEQHGHKPGGRIPPPGWENSNDVLLYLQSCNAQLQLFLRFWGGTLPTQVAKCMEDAIQ